MCVSVRTGLEFNAHQHRLRPLFQSRGLGVFMNVFLSKLTLCRMFLQLGVQTELGKVYWIQEEVPRSCAYFKPSGSV